MSFLKALCAFIVVGWMLLTTTSASLLLPNSEAAWDRWTFATCSHNNDAVRLKLFVLFHLLYTYMILLPCASYLWILDEILYGGYRTIVIERPVITVSAPRAGTTSFHRTLALDEQFVTPIMLELVLPFLCLQKLIYAVHSAFPSSIRNVEAFLKWINRVTPQVEARHPVSLFAPDADDILVSEWHWSSVGAVRTFPLVSHWKKHYQMSSTRQRRRSLLLHRRMCQKIMYQRGNMPSSNSQQFQHKRLLLRSHLSPCLDDFQNLFPDATYLSILRDPEDILRSFAGLSKTAVRASTGVDIFQRATTASSNTNPSWSTVAVDILADMMQREADLCHSNKQSHYVTFGDFQSDPARCLETLYEKANLIMSPQMKVAIQGGLGHHETYKTRHVYQNPSLEELGIDRDVFRELPGVKRYTTLLERQ